MEHPAGEDQLLAPDPHVAIDAERRIVGPLIAQLERDLPRALGGSRFAVRSYVQTWREVRRVTVEAIRHARFEPFGLPWGTEVEIVDEALDLAAILAPVSPWVAAYGLGLGTAGALLAQVRSYLVGVTALEPPDSRGVEATLHMSRDQVMRFAHLVLEELAGDKTPLGRVSEIFDLNLTNLGRLFGVTRQAILQWTDVGVPSARQGKLGTVLATAELLERKLRPGRVALAARRPADTYGGRTMLEMIEVDLHEELYRSVRDSFDWSATA